jgi:hypothetical protein
MTACCPAWPVRPPMAHRADAALTRQRGLWAPIQDSPADLPSRRNARLAGPFPSSPGWVRLTRSGNGPDGSVPSPPSLGGTVTTGGGASSSLGPAATDFCKAAGLATSDWRLSSLGADCWRRHPLLPWAPPPFFLVTSPAAFVNMPPLVLVMGAPSHHRANPGAACFCRPTGQSVPRPVHPWASPSPHRS